MSDDVIRVELERILERDGVLSASAVVEAARNPDNPLHRWEGFVWDDEKAAELQRIEAARRLIRSVRIIVTTETVSIRVPLFLRDPSADPNEQGYTSVPRLRADSELAREALVAEFSRASAALQRAKDYATVFGMQSEVGAIAKRITKAANKVRTSPAVNATQ